MAQLKIFERQNEDIIVFELSGDITFGEGNIALRDAIRRVLSEDKNKITLDFRNVCYIDSSGIGELISGLTAVNREDGQLKLLNLSARAKDLLLICKLLPIFDVCEDEADAVSGIG